MTKSRQISVPAHAQRALGLKPGDRLDVSVEGNSIIYTKPRFTLENVFGSVPARPGDDPGDFEQLIHDAQATSINREKGKLTSV
jgi:AbrB family looped-hinge helix DNA binding protein